MIKCKYCGGTNGVKNRHITSCPFNPKNNKKIVAFLEEEALKDKEFLIYEYNNYASKEKLPVALTMHSLFIRNGWIKHDAKVHDVFIYFIYRSYELNLISNLEILDIMTYKLTFGMFGLTTQDYLNRAQQISMKSGVEQLSILKQYERLKGKILECQN